jgi:D-serine deaminase-like pyridoxal phosphate-dependent protein
MPQRPPARHGDPLSAVDTPALVIDLDRFETNLDAMEQFARDRSIRVRPHAKTHKSPDVARAQITRGAVGQCCQKVSEAEVLVDGGIEDILISNEVIGQAKLDRVGALAKRARISICVDSALGIAQLADAVAMHRSTIDVLVEIDVGQRRCGVTPGPDTAALAAHVSRSPGLVFAGLQAYHGAAQHMRTVPERQVAADHVAQSVAKARAALAAVGFEPRIIGGAGTGTFALEAARGAITELQPGSYVFMDADYARNATGDAALPVFGQALYVLATVMSQSLPDRAVVDAGHKALPVDSGLPLVRGLSGAQYQRPSDEHGILDLTGTPEALRPELGDKVLLIPGHCDPTVNQHDWYVGVRGLDGPAPTVECLWPILARGALF